MLPTACLVQYRRDVWSAAVTVLRVDQIIMAKRAGGPKPGGGGPPGGDMSEYI